MANSPQVEIRDLHFGYGDNPSETLDGVTFDVMSGECLVLLGESGCGKTTLLRCIAGLERPNAGVITVGARTLTDMSKASAGGFVAPEKRNIGMVFQQWALFGHMSVADNVGYGLKGSKRDKSEKVSALLDQVGLAGFGSRSPASLSGGQQQRVALARALAPEPAVLLLDEPFSNLDAQMRIKVRSEVQALLKELSITSIFVTHDQEEAFVLGDRVAVMDSGKILQIDTPKVLYRRPNSEYVAKFLGDVNIVDTDTVASSWNYHPNTGAAGGSAGGGAGEAGAAEGGGAGVYVIRPEQFTLTSANPGGASERGRNTGDTETASGTDTGTATDTGSGTVGVSGVISQINFYGHDALVSVDTDLSSEPILIRTDPFSDFEIGEQVTIELRDNTVLHTL